MRTLALLLGAVACGADPGATPTDTGSTSLSPTTPTSTTPTVPVVCPTVGTGELSLSEVCVHGACAGMDYYEVSTIFEEAGSCSPHEENDHWLWCSWPSIPGLELFFIGGSDGIPDSEDESSVYDWDARLTGAFSGTTETGLGLGVPVACFEAELGPAEPGAEASWVDDRTNIVVRIDGEVEEGLVGALTVSWSYDE